MKVIAFVIVVGLMSLCSADRGLAQPATIQPGESGLLGALPQEALPKIERLARLLQQQINEGVISEGQIGQELHQGNLAEFVRSLSPEARELLDDLSASLQANHSEDLLSLMLSGFVGRAP